MAIETRVHNLWNHLIESASLATGSLLIWDIGEYSILPRHKNAVETDDELSESEFDASNRHQDGQSENEKLFDAFQHVCFSLHPILSYTNRF